MGSTLSWVFCSGFLDGQDWLIYSAIGEATSWLPCLSETAEQGPEPSWLVVWDLNQTNLYAKFLDQTRPPLLHCRWGNSWSVHSVQVPP